MKQGVCLANFPRVNKVSTYVNSFYFLSIGAPMSDLSDIHIPQGGHSVGSASLAIVGSLHFAQGRRGWLLLKKGFEIRFDPSWIGMFIIWLTGFSAHLDFLLEDKESCRHLFHLWDAWLPHPFASFLSALAGDHQCAQKSLLGRTHPVICLWHLHAHNPFFF